MLMYFLLKILVASFCCLLLICQLHIAAELVHYLHERLIHDLFPALGDADHIWILPCLTVISIPDIGLRCAVFCTCLPPSGVIIFAASMHVIGTAFRAKNVNEHVKKIPARRFTNIHRMAGILYFRDLFGCSGTWQQYHRLDAAWGNKIDTHFFCLFANWPSGTYRRIFAVLPVSGNMSISWNLCTRRPETKAMARSDISHFTSGLLYGDFGCR